ncbi:MAG: hypothetical protein IPK26_16470 [Planctomycetes bacterium]|nr:hypothetical protein [Planctomycetota bacterium]
MMRIPLSVLFPTLLALPICAQKATYEWQRKTTTIAYNPVPVGKHGLDDLKVGDSWRLGMNEASTWTLQRPIMDKRMLPAGAFRVALRRHAEDQLTLVLIGSGLALGGGEDLEVEGRLQDLPKPNSKLDIAFSVPPAERSKTDSQGVNLDVAFGKKRWHSQVILLGAKAEKVGSWTLEVVTASGQLARTQGKPAAIGLLTKKGGKGPEAWNLVLAGDEARLVPVMAAPTANFGFGEPTPPDPAWTTAGKAVAADRNEPAKTIELESFTAKNGEFTIVVSALKERLTLTLPEPKGPKS